MASRPIITFKAGQCIKDGKKIRPVDTPGYIYLYSEDDLLHFCWRPRSAPSTEPEIDLIMFPGDGTFTPYIKTPSSATQSDKHSPTNGRVFMLKFSSSNERHFFWMQAKSQHNEGTPSWFSERDQHIGEIINQLLSGEDVDVDNEVEGLRQNGHGGDDDHDDDDVMEDVQDPETEPDHHRQGSGGAGQDATGGDTREEGEESRRGGEDGGRAASDDPAAVVQNFLRSLQGGSTGTAPQPQQSFDKPFTTLTELLNTENTIPFLSTASPAQIDALCIHLPPSLFLLSQESNDSYGSAEPSSETTKAAIEALSAEQKREILARVLRSPQLHQSLGSLTVAIRDGGLPMIGEALGVELEHGGLIRGGSVPLGGGEAVEAFLDGVKRGVDKENK